MNNNKILTDALKKVQAMSPSEIEAARTGLAGSLKKFMDDHGDMSLDDFMKYCMEHPAPKADYSNVEYQSKHFKHGLVMVPADWPVATVDDPEQADFACAVNIKPNQSGLEVPIFLVFLKKHPNSLTRHDYMQIMEACKAEWPAFQDVIDKEIYYNGRIYVDNIGHSHSQAEYIAAPWVGVFPIDPMCQGTGLTLGCSITYKSEEDRQQLRKKMPY